MREINHEEMAEKAIQEHAEAGYKRPRYEVPNPTPMAPPVGYKRAPSLMEQVRDMVRSESLRQAAEASGMETFEESEDFDVGEGWDPTSPWEEQFDPVETLRQTRLYEQSLRDAADLRDREEAVRRGLSPEGGSRAAEGGRSEPLTRPEGSKNPARSPAGGRASKASSEEASDD